LKQCQKLKYSDQFLTRYQKRDIGEMQHQVWTGVNQTTNIHVIINQINQDYIAEYFNTITNLYFINLGIYGLFNARKGERKNHKIIQFMYLGLIIVGFGSI
jgi:uncharacterized protein YegJ (DUF2314 family)